MSVQSTVKKFHALQTPGTLVIQQPSRLETVRASNAGFYGYVTTWGTSNDYSDTSIVAFGGTGKLAGIAVQGRAGYVSALNAQLNIAIGDEFQACSMGGIAVKMPTSANIGDVVAYQTTTGAILGAFVDAAAFTTAALPNSALIPNAKVDYFSVLANEVAIVTLTN
jgi:hypothetical protein